jgi:hypothetical protein
MVVWISLTFSVLSGVVDFSGSNERSLAFARASRLRTEAGYADPTLSDPPAVLC